MSDVVSRYLAERMREDAILVRRVLEQLDYVAHTGMLVTISGRIPMTKRKPGKHGMVNLLGDNHSSAKLVWVWHHHSVPPNGLRHANKDKADDRIGNLRLRLLDGSVEGIGARWVARMPGAPRNEIIGVFRSYEKALAAYESYKLCADLV